MPTGIYKRKPFSEEAKKNMGLASLGRKHTKKTKRKMSWSKRNEKHPFWKGDEAGYWSFHKWLDRHCKKLKKCQHCRKKKKLDWALKRGRKYKRDRKSYLNLCRSCHLKYDYTEERKKKMSITNKLNRIKI